MRRLNIGITSEAEEVIIETKKKQNFSNRDETVDFIIKEYGKRKK